MAIYQWTGGVDLPTDVRTSAMHRSFSLPGYVSAKTTQNVIYLWGKTCTAVDGNHTKKIADAHNIATGTLEILKGLLPDGSNLLTDVKSLSLSDLSTIRCATGRYIRYAHDRFAFLDTHGLGWP